MSAPDNCFDISKWRGEFTDPVMERAYRRHVEPTMAAHLRTSVRIWAGLLLVFGYLDYMALGLSSGFYQLMGMRIFGAVLLLIFSFKLRLRPELATSGYAVTALEIIGFLLFFLIYFIRPDITVWNIGVTLILLICSYIFIPNRVVLTNLAALFGIAGTLLCVEALGTDAGRLVGLLFILCLPTIVGFIAALRLQTVQRRQFALLTEMSDMNKSLQLEIERREELEGELKRQATTDPLTGLFNRRQYEMLFHRERERSRRLNVPLSLCVLDLDHFKNINDKYGHDVGDQVLRHVAALLVNTLRQTDIVGRFGGEEFILLLPETDLDQASGMVNRLRLQLQNAPLDTDAGKISLTATFGLTEVYTGDSEIEAAVKRADKALYDGKQRGRNQVVTVRHERG